MSFLVCWGVKHEASSVPCPPEDGRFCGEKSSPPLVNLLNDGKLAQVSRRHTLRVVVLSWEVKGELFIFSWRGQEPWETRGIITRAMSPLCPNEAGKDWANTTRVYWALHIHDPINAVIFRANLIRFIRIVDTAADILPCWADASIHTAGIHL